MKETELFQVSKWAKEHRSFAIAGIILAKLGVAVLGLILGCGSLRASQPSILQGHSTGFEVQLSRVGIPIKGKMKATKHQGIQKRWVTNIVKRIVKKIIRKVERTTRSKSWVNKLLLTSLAIILAGGLLFFLAKFVISLAMQQAFTLALLVAIIGLSGVLSLLALGLFAVYRKGKK